MMIIYIKQGVLNQVTVKPFKGTARQGGLHEKFSEIDFSILKCWSWFCDRFSGSGIFEIEYFQFEA